MGSGDGSFTSNDKELTASGNWGGEKLGGGKGSVDGAISGYKMIVAPGATLGGVRGGWNMGTGGATGNTVIIGSGATINGEVVGGVVMSNNAIATYNTVELCGATVNGNVRGGWTEDSFGVGNRVAGNTLVLSGVNTVTGFVQNFETIKLSDALAWKADATVLNATGTNHLFTNQVNKMTLDISAATNLKNATPGTMTLLSAPNKSDVFDGFKLKDFAGTITTLSTDGTQVFNETAANAKNGVTLSYDATHTVKLADVNNKTKNAVTYNVAADVTTVTLGEMTWGTARDANTGFNYAGATVDASGLTFTNPETISAGNTSLLTANNTLANIAATVKNIAYQYTPVAGVTLDGQILGSYAGTGGTVTYTATENKADKLTFGDVEWKDSGVLIDHATDATKNIDFNGAAVDTSNINFTNIQSLEANKKMTLVSDFGNTVGTITGTKYKVGSTLEGEGKASLVDGDLIFTAETGTPKSAPTPTPTPSDDDDNGGNSGGNGGGSGSNDSGGSGELVLEVQEQTHNTVMGAMAGMAALSAGNDFIGAATDGLAFASNVGADGVSSFAQMGGGSMRQETGSHVDTHTWNAILALGTANKKERGTFEYGAFFEYGSGNYTTHNGNERGDGSAHYTGGGLLAKWTAKHGFYVEGSLRAGTVHDDARNVLRDAFGNPYSYETNANYFGGHIGVGKEITLANGNVVDVYGKYFVNRRNGVSFDAGGRYDLDPVTSQIVRIGARYTVKSSKWSFYAGAAYEHEMDGKATGKADGFAIRGADTSGGSFRGELGATVTPDKNVPVTLDFNLTGFAGKKQGLSGGVSVALMF